jgi:hypothetical protein
VLPQARRKLADLEFFFPGAADSRLSQDGTGLFVPEMSKLFVGGAAGGFVAGALARLPSEVIALGYR